MTRIVQICRRLILSLFVRCSVFTAISEFVLIFIRRVTSSIIISLLNILSWRTSTTRSIWLILMILMTMRLLLMLVMAFLIVMILLMVPALCPILVMDVSWRRIRKVLSLRRIIFSHGIKLALVSRVKTILSSSIISLILEV